MAICYNCGHRFYGRECSRCGWIANYKCWNCKTNVNTDDEMCGKCKWFICRDCDCCGCQEERPVSKQEEEDFTGLRTRTIWD